MSSVRCSRATVHPHGVCWAQSRTDCIVTIIVIVPRCSVFCVLGRLLAASSTEHLKSERKYVEKRNTNKRTKRKEKQTQVLQTTRFEWSVTTASEERYPHRARPVSGTSSCSGASVFFFDRCSFPLLLPKARHRTRLQSHVREASVVTWSLRVFAKHRLPSLQSPCLHYHLCFSSFLFYDPYFSRITHPSNTQDADGYAAPRSVHGRRE